MIPDPPTVSGMHQKVCLYWYVTMHPPSNVYEVRFIGNPISAVLNDTFSGKNAIRVLWIAYNEVHTIDFRGFYGLTGIEDLHINDNHLDQFKDGVFDYMPTLQTLFMENNRITHIQSGLFSELRSLMSLDISGNKLTLLEQGTLLGLGFLETLNLENNELNTLKPGSLAHAPNMTQLNLKDNSITTMLWTVFASENYSATGGKLCVLSMKLSGNPILCNNDICWIKEGENEGCFTWTDGSENAPECTNAVWSSLSLQCKGK